MAVPSFGTNTTFDVLRNSPQPVAQFGKDRAWDAISSYLQAVNVQRDELLADLVDKTTDRLRRYGAVSTFKVQRMDEMGTPNVQKGRGNYIVGFPLDMYQIATGWDRKYWRTHSAREFAAQVEQVVTAFSRAIMGNIKVAIYGGTNYSYVDHLVDHLHGQFALPVKALANADGQPIPPGPNGENFGFTHTHYLASVTLTNAWLTALVNTVVEHTNEGQCVLWINRQQEAGVSALADFKPLINQGITPSANQEYGQGTKDPNRINNRMIGWFLGAEVWVKPHQEPNYIFCWLKGAQNKQPIAMRVRGTTADGGEPAENAGDIELIFNEDIHPLSSTGWEQEYGMGVWNRTSAAIGYIGAASYQIPDNTMIQGWF